MVSMSANALLRASWTSVSQRFRGYASSVSVHQQTQTDDSGLRSATKEGEETTKNAKPFNSIPQPFKLPLFGHTYMYRLGGPYRIERYHEALRSLHARYGPVVRQELQGGADGTVVHVFELPDVKKVLRHTGPAPIVPPIQEGSRLYRVSRGHAVGLGNMNGEEWSGLRRSVQQALLQPRQVEHFLPATDQEAQRLVKCITENQLPSGGVASLYSLLACWYLETSGRIMFEKSLGALGGNGAAAEEEARQWVQSNCDIFRHNSRLKVSSPLFKIFPIKPWRDLVHAEDLFHHIASKHVAAALKKIQALANEGRLSEGKFSFLTHLMSRDEVTHADLVFFVHSMVSEGLATVPSIMQNSIYCLANNPDVQEKAFEEVSKVVSDCNEPFTPEIIEKMPYIKAIIKETFRVFPIGTEVSRVLRTDLILGGYLVPAGTVVDLNHSCLLSSEQYFPEPKKFKPERWLRGEDATANAILLTPFGHGPRMCVGRRFSQQTIYTGLARLIQKYRFINPENDLPYAQTYQTLLFPSRELTTKFLPR